MKKWKRKNEKFKQGKNKIKTENKIKKMEKKKQK